VPPVYLTAMPGNMMPDVFILRKKGFKELLIFLCCKRLSIHIEKTLTNKNSLNAVIKIAVKSVFFKNGN
jgi:hypothetical protein